MQHHHNSVEFKCSCGKLHHWKGEAECFTAGPGTGVDGQRYWFIHCPCGIDHWKLRKNFRGE